VHSDTQCLELMIALQRFLDNYWCDDRGSLNRDIVEKIDINVGYLRHHRVYTQAMKNIMKLFNERIDDGIHKFEKAYFHCEVYNSIPRVQCTESDCDTSDEEEEEEIPVRVNPFFPYTQPTPKEKQPRTPLRKVKEGEEVKSDELAPYVDPFPRALLVFINFMGKWLGNITRKLYFRSKCFLNLFMH